MNPYLKKAKEIKAEMDALLAKAKEENRVFTDEEQTKFDELKTSFDKNIQMSNAVKVADDQSDLFDSAAPGSDETRIDVGDTHEPKWKNDGEFFHAVANFAIHHVKDNRLPDPVSMKDAALGQQTAVPSEGGFLLEPETTEGLLKKTYEVAVVANKCRKQPIGKGKRELVRNYVKESSRVAGSRWGGIRGYWIEEAGTLNASTQKIAQQKTPLNKLAGLCYVSEEMLEDGTALIESIKQDFPNEFGWMLDDAILNGNGAGQPLGIKNSQAVVSVGKETGQTAATINYENISKMWMRMWAKSRPNAVWFINQDCEMQLDTMALVVGTGGVPVYMPANGISGTPYSTLKGRPVIPIEHCETCGTTGDIMLLDLSQYQIIDKAGIKFAESIHVQFLTDQRAYRFIYHVGGQPIWEKALTPAKGANTLSPFVKLDTRS